MFVPDYRFGYPVQCTKCSLNTECQSEKLLLNVGPSYRDGVSNKRLMLIGQDPTIRNKKRKVDLVLMLNRKGTFYKWLGELLGDSFEKIDVYATNVIKCTFLGNLPTERDGMKAHGFLRPFFDNCKEHLINEISNYRPHYIISFGEPAHHLLANGFFGCDVGISPLMAVAFNHGFYDTYINYNDELITFKYSPCLHVQTFRVADTYGKRVKEFKEELRTSL